jgi:hypothetical protein
VVTANIASPGLNGLIYYIVIYSFFEGLFPMEKNLVDISQREIDKISAGQGINIHIIDTAGFLDNLAGGAIAASVGAALGLVVCLGLYYKGIIK